MKENEDQLLFHYHERNDREVARRIRAGQTDFVTGTGWALLDKFFIFLQEVGFYRVLEEVEGKGYQRIMVALIRLLTTYSGYGAFGYCPSEASTELSLPGCRIT